MVVWQKPEESGLDFNTLIAESKVPGYAFNDVQDIVVFLEENCVAGDHIVVMSNGGFGAIHEKLLKALDHGPVSLQSQ
jgi:UDP-N-acetylmuramate: L-alanyl-gamma-D-glutamyl-meso-diaminopimelate ligase